MTTAESTVRVGVAGWSYPDWDGVVYPKPRPEKFDPLVHLASMVDVIEINSTHYNPSSEKNALSWASRARINPRFRFTVKLWQKLSHDRADPQSKDIAASRVVPDALARRDVLGAVLLQFPWSFQNERDNRRRLVFLVRELSDLPLAVEVRHSSWDTPAFYETLRDLETAFVNIDQPVIGKSMGPSAVVTAPHSYVRLHGRNYDQWFREEAGRDNRYDYLYSESEIKQWNDRVETMSGLSREVFVIYNNHFKGQALANAIRMKKIRGENIESPSPLFPMPLGPDEKK